MQDRLRISSVFSTCHNCSGGIVRRTILGFWISPFEIISEMKSSSILCRYGPALDCLSVSGGGIAIAHAGTIIEKIDFPLGETFSLEPALRRIQNRLKEMGSPFDKPIFALHSGLPHFA
jgi:hypothetical protein